MFSDRLSSIQKRLQNYAYAFDIVYLSFNQNVKIVFKLRTYSRIL